MGDFGTILPIIFGVAVVTDINLGTILLFFAVWYTAVGILYRLPVPVEPMKAIGAIVIAEGLTSPEIAASGIIIGIIFIAIGYLRGMSKIQRWIPKNVIRGIQAGLALLLLKTSLNFVVNDIFYSAVSVIIILIFLLITMKTAFPDLSALIVVGIGIAAGIVTAGIPEMSFIALPQVIIPDVNDFAFSSWNLVIPQIPLTLTNAILATSLLAHDLFKKDINPDKLSKTIGFMNLISCPLGGFPMCHGAGGMGAMHRFGARTGGSNIIAGIIFLGLALFFAKPEMLGIIPLGIFGGLLIFAAIPLLKASANTDSVMVTAITAILAPFAGMTVAFIAGMLLAYIEIYRKKGIGQTIPDK
ncbi:putative sulfate/molybdate transporter [Methanoplanus endosymbiosus]|uniref:Sulfate/molybdate transporter n=1 Tax=Methanoplanus endosymbiosus TaxID=33865 RepID=A0A9E7PLJ9_9EURY|nr:putative sulfate/molybdate transporter [Methanoplanus endosymbiosus]UUX91592.1 putative sulfate/molybdate transporter [Methanoplanus endosymbiosus]